MLKYTPGPWKVLPEECDKPYIRIRGTNIGDRYKVANVLTPVYDGVLAREAEETRANAHLIAAAPDLLETLQDILFRIENSDYWWMDNPDIGGFDVVAIRSAILKAKGSDV